MLRISAMNLMLHSISNPEIDYKDSVSKQNQISDRFTMCLANPPFKGTIDAESIHDNLKAVTNTKKTELLFLALFLRMLKKGGQCACIVPDGVLFGSSSAHKSIRKELVENHQLRAVISMPSGVFKPYAGVSTAVLVFTKTGAGGTDKVWFYDMKPMASASTISVLRLRITISPISFRDSIIWSRKPHASAPSRAFSYRSRRS